MKQMKQLTPEPFYALVQIDGKFYTLDSTGNTAEHENVSRKLGAEFPQQPNVEIITPVGEVETTFLEGESFRTKSLKPTNEGIVWETIKASWKLRAVVFEKEAVGEYGGSALILYRNLTQEWVEAMVNGILEGADVSAAAPLTFTLELPEISITFDLAKGIGSKLFDQLTA